MYVCMRLCDDREFELTWVPSKELEMDLRLPSMLHGKKGFERISWAFRNVLTNPVTWLFYDFKHDISCHENGESS